MIVVVGDIHGFFEPLQRLNKFVKPTDTIIQVGDFGIWPDSIKRWKALKAPVYFIEGNHEYMPLIPSSNEVTEVAKKLFYVPRGSVLEIEGKSIGFCGGACSLDRYYRKNGIDWFPSEKVNLRDVQSLLERVNTLDFLITHAAPASISLSVCGPLSRDHWGLPSNWKDESADVIEKLYQHMLASNKHTKLFCGHLHKSFFNGRCKVLNINEALAIT